MSLEDCRSRLPGVSLWRALGLPDAEKLDKLGGGKKEVTICSPFRADSSPSFSVFLNEDGTVGGKDWSHDQSYNDFGLIAAVTGIPETDKKGLLKKYHELAGVPWDEGGKRSGGSRKPVAPKREPEPVKVQEVKQSASKGSRGVKEKVMDDVSGSSSGAPKVVAEYDYVDEDGEVLHQTLRYEPKTFRQRRKPVAGDAPGDEKGGWVWKLSGAWRRWRAGSVDRASGCSYAWTCQSCQRWRRMLCGVVRSGWGRRAGCLVLMMRIVRMRARG